MSKTEEEPYKVAGVRYTGEVRWMWLEGRLQPCESKLGYFNVTYPMYTKRANMTIIAKDELEAFMKGQRELNKRKAAVDKAIATKNAKKEQTNVNR